ncbi:MAG: MBL fold metallo-hydrolase [Acidimicrobiia bacterium]|nr:MBL fold metallo-hydrolase [Acidimicrobiia bacterium]
MRLIFEQHRTGGDRNFGYLLADRDAAAGVLIDPSYDPDGLVARAHGQSIRITHIVNTHGHPDHTNGNQRAVELTGAPVVGHPALPDRPDVAVADGSELTVGSLRLRFLFVPGHAADHLIVFEPEWGLALTGDHLFVGKVGGTTSEAAAREEWESLQRMLLALPDQTSVWPGHDYGVRPSSTIALERATNPFLRCADLTSFLHLKAGWPDYKRRFGLK